MKLTETVFVLALLVAALSARGAPAPAPVAAAKLGLRTTSAGLVVSERSVVTDAANSAVNEAKRLTGLSRPVIYGIAIGVGLLILLIICACCCCCCCR